MLVTDQEAVLEYIKRRIEYLEEDLKKLSSHLARSSLPYANHDGVLALRARIKEARQIHTDLEGFFNNYG